MKNNPLKIGITGGIGSGKTVVSKIFSVLSVPVYDADTRAKWISNFHPEVKKEITALFGPEAYQDGKFNTRYIASIVFKEKEKTAQLNAIVHPRVGEDFEQWAAQHNNFPYLLKEAALMYESDSYKQMDKIIVVSAPLELRIKRILARDPQRTEAEVRGIIDKQMPEAEKLKRADFIIYNDDQQLLIPQVVALDKQFKL
ncbi:MAG TPA: dephospho-CoA kinase [Cytophagaceae bacterium]|nr:dephospho-CoA kinase [Cytophagaceae bacterium]